MVRGRLCMFVWGLGLHSEKDRNLLSVIPNSETSGVSTPFNLSTSVYAECSQVLWSSAGTASQIRRLLRLQNFIRWPQRSPLPREVGRSQGTRSYRQTPGHAGRWGVWGEPHVSTPPGAEAQTARPVGTCRMWADTRDRLREA